MIKKFIGNRIRECRNAKGYSQEKFAQVSGIDRTYIASVEAGKRNITIENLYKIATALDITLEELVSDHSIRKIVIDVSNEKFILETSKELSRDEKNYIDAICSCVYDEDSSLLDVLPEDKGIDDLSPYEIVDLIKLVIEKEMDLTIRYVPIAEEYQVK